MSEIRREIVKNENGILLLKSIAREGIVYFVDEKTSDGGFNRKFASKSFIAALNIWYEIAQGVHIKE